MSNHNSIYQINPIGYIEKTDEETSIVVYELYKDALKNIEKFSHLIILWWINERDTPEDRALLLVNPKDRPTAPITGVFTCRSPARPNPIGHTIVMLKYYKKSTNRLVIDRIDAFHNTPVVDIKPYFPSSDLISNVTIPEWFSDLRVPRNNFDQVYF